MCGFNYSVYKGCPTDSDGAIKELADSIIGGWAATEQQANKNIIEILEG